MTLHGGANMKFAIMGAGNVGYAISAYLSYKGADVFLYTRQPEKAQTINKIGISTTGAIEGTYKVECVTDPAEAINGSDCIIVTTTANAHKDILTKIAPFLENNQKILMTNANWGAFEAKQILYKEIQDKNLYVAETSSQLCVASSKEIGSVNFSLKLGILLAALEKNKSKLFIFDQILEPQQLYRIAHYFDEDVRFVVFDRDPRDMFLSSKYIWSKSQNYSILPTEIKNYIHFYSRLLASEKIIEDDRILRIHFEDMIYNYDSSVEKIEKFVGKKILGEHKYKKQFFNPEVSIKNTQVFNSNSSWKDEIQIIEESCLKDRLYKFPYTVHANEDEFSDPNPDTSKRN